MNWLKILDRTWEREREVALVMAEKHEIGFSKMG